MKVRAAQVFYVLAVVGFCLSLLAHALTLLSINPLHKFPLGCLLLVALSLALLPPFRAAWAEEDVHAPAPTGVPRALVFMIVLVLYVFLDFFYVMVVLHEGGNERQVGDRYYIMAHGSIIRELTRREYEERLVHFPRILSSGFILYYFMGVVFLYRRMKKARAEVRGRI